MTIPFEEIAAKWLKDPAVKAEYDRLGPEFEAYAESLRARKSVAAKAPDLHDIVQPDINLSPER